MSKSGIRGLSAAEAVVALALFGLIATLVVGLFTRGLRISAKESVHLELEQSCHFLLQEVERALTRSGVSGLSYVSGADLHGVAINEIEDITSEGNLAWKGEQIYYYWLPQSEELKKQRIVSSTTPRPTPRRFSAGELTALISQPGSVIGEGVIDFKAANRNDDGTSRLVDLAVELERRLPNDQPRRFRLEKVVTILN